MRTDKMTYLNLSIPAATKSELKRLCEESNVSLSKAIQDYVAASSKAGRLITTEIPLSKAAIKLITNEVRKTMTSS